MSFCTGSACCVFARVQIRLSSPAEGLASLGNGAVIHSVSLRRDRTGTFKHENRPKRAQCIEKHSLDKAGTMCLMNGPQLQHHVFSLMAIRSNSSHGGPSVVAVATAVNVPCKPCRAQQADRLVERVQGRQPLKLRRRKMRLALASRRDERRNPSSLQTPPEARYILRWPGRDRASKGLCNGSVGNLWRSAGPGGTALACNGHSCFATKPSKHSARHRDEKQGAHSKRCERERADESSRRVWIHEDCRLLRAGQHSRSGQLRQVQPRRHCSEQQRERSKPTLPGVP